MSRTFFNFLLDSLLLAAFAALVWTSVVVRFVFPPGTAASGWQLWGLTYDQWSNVQFAMVAVLALGILLHVMMHWTWVCGFVAARVGRGRKGKLDDGTETIYGVGLLIVIFNILGLAIAAAAVSIEAPR